MLHNSGCNSYRKHLTLLSLFYFSLPWEGIKKSGGGEIEADDFNRVEIKETDCYDTVNTSAVEQKVVSKMV